jgi:NifU-like protein
MAVYPKKIELRAFTPRHAVVGADSAVCGRSASFVCGCYVSFSLTTDQTKTSASFSSNGCGYMVAIADILAEIVTEKDVSELHGLDRGELIAEVVREIGALPAAREHCAEVCFEALRSTFVALRERRVEEFRGEEALICTCFGVSERVIEKFVSLNRDVGVEMVANACRAGSGCGSCRMLIQEIIDSREA